MNKQVLLQKWCDTGDEYSPRQEYVVKIPGSFLDDDDWYFSPATKTALPRSRVYDSPRAAALGVIERNQKAIHQLETLNARVLDWYNKLPDESGAA